MTCTDHAFSLLFCRGLHLGNPFCFVLEIRVSIFSKGTKIEEEVEDFFLLISALVYRIS